MTPGDASGGRRRPDEEEELRLIAAEWMRRTSEAPPGDAPDLVTTARSWSALRARLLAEGLIEPTAASPPRRMGRARLAIAALVVLLFGAMSVIVHLQSQVEDLTAPRVNAAVYDLVPAEERLRGTELQEISLPDAQTTAVLHLNLSELTAYDAYAVEIWTCDDRISDPLWRLPVERRTNALNFNVVFPPGALSSGCYRIQVVGLSDGAPRVLAEYPLRVLDE